MLTVFKDKNNQYRWVGLSSNAFRDRDGEIVSTKALAQDVIRADKDGDYGDLHWWHTTVKLGTTDFNMLHGRILLESGVLDDDVAQLVARKASDYQLSIGFAYPPSEPDGDGVFNNIQRKERSLVPAGLAANPLTKFSTVKETKMNEQEKILALKALLGNDLAEEKLSDAEVAEKAADGMKLAFKSQDEASKFMREVIEAGLALKEASLEVEAEDKSKLSEKEYPYPQKGKPYPGEAEKMDAPHPMNGYMEKMDGYMNEMKGYMNKMHGYAEGMDGMVRKMGGYGHKEVSPNLALDDLSSRFKSIETQLTSILSEQPPATAGVRPSQSTSNTIEGVDVFAQKALVGDQPKNAFDGFLDFLSPNGDGQGGA